MKNLFAIIMVSLLSLPVGTAVAGGGGIDGVARFDTEMTYKETIKRLTAAVKAEKMRVVTRASASQGAFFKGDSIKGNMIVGVFRNDYAQRLLTASVKAGIEAPIRFYIIERRDGSASLSYKVPSAIFAPYLAGAEPELADLAKELDGIFAAIAVRATKEN